MMDNSNWKVKLEALQKLKEEKKEEIKKHMKLYLIYLKQKLKDFKETNLNLIKEVYSQLLDLTQQPDYFHREEYDLVVDFILEKLGDKKFQENNLQLLQHCSTILSS